MTIITVLMISRELVLNAISLGFGFAGNFCLLMNFTRRIRYIIALPLSIIFWYLATAIVSLIQLLCRCDRIATNYLAAH